MASAALIDVNKLKLNPSFEKGYTLHWRSTAPPSCETICPTCGAVLVGMSDAS